MSQNDVLPNPLILKIQEYSVSIIIAVAILGALVLTYFIMTNQTQPQAISDTFSMETLIPGTGSEAKSGDTVSVNYVGTLKNGTKFDSSYDRNQAFSFSLGAGQVIQGWDQGVVGMKVGEKRKLIIPAAMGYGARAIGTIPANSTLIFEVELLKIN